MSRKLTLSLVALLLVVTSVTAWGATTPRYLMRSTPIQVDGRNELPHPPTATRTFGTPYQVGSAVGTPGTHFGFTWYDYQHNGSLGRQIAEFGGKIQASWMKGDDASVSLRSARWNAADVQGSAVPYTLDNGGSINLFPLSAPLITNGQPFTGNRPGYVNHRNRAGGKGTTIYHDAPEAGGGAFWAVQVDQSAGNGLFTGSSAPQPAGAEYVADGVIWPKSVYNNCGGQDYLHTIASWSGATNELWYWKGTLNGDGTMSFAAPVLLDEEPYITGVIEAFGDEVSVAYMKANNNTNWDLMLIQSSNCGDTWGTPINVTNFLSTGPEGCNTECALNYDAAGVLHILYSTVPGSGGVVPTNFYHWDNSTLQHRLITTAGWTNRCGGGSLGTGTNNGAGNAQGAIADPGLTIKPAGLGPGGGIADELMYAVWTQYKSNNVDCATVDGVGTPGGLVNGEIYWSTSSNGGQTWDRPQNMTGTVTPDCDPPDCNSEGWSTVAPEADSGVYISYMHDLHAGGAVNGEGVWFEGSYKVMAVEARLPVLEPVIAVTPTNFIELNAKTTGNQTVTFNVASVGNADLTFSVDVQADNGGLSHVLVNGGGSYSNTIIAGSAPDVITVTYDGVGLPDPSEQNWRIEVTSNDVTNDPNQGGAAIDVTLQVFVADQWFTCTEDTLSTGQHRMAVSSCLELGNQGGGSGYFNYADSTEWMFSGSPIITRNDGVSNLAYRNYFMAASDRTRDSNKSFRAIDSAMAVTRTGASDIARGTAVSTDTTIKIDYEMMAFKDPALTNGGIMKYTMTNLTGSAMTSVDWGAGADLDVSSDSSTSAENVGIGDASKGYIGQQAVIGDTLGSVGATTDNYMALFHVDFAPGCPSSAVAAQVLDNNDYVYSGLSMPTDSVFKLMDDFGSAASWGTSIYGGPIDTVSDLNVLLVTNYNQTLSPGVPVTWGFGYASSTVSIADLETTISALRLAVNGDCGACPITMTGDVNLNGSITSADIIYLVGFVFKGGPAPLPCAASGDVNCNGSVTSADIIYLVGFVFKGGPPPCDVCTLIPGTWTCP